MAATISLPGTASATTHHHAYFQRVNSGVRASFRPRFAAYHSRFASPRRAGNVGFTRSHYAGRHLYGRHAVAWAHPRFRRLVAAAAPAAPVAPTAGLFGALPDVAAPITGATPAAPAQVAAAPAVVRTPVPVVATRRPSLRAAGGGAQTGQASFYGLHSRTANGSRVGAATCAHRSLPFGTRVLVTNLANARQAVLTVNDRGPFVRGRIVDVSVGAAGALGMLHSGTAPVRVQVVGGPG